MPSVPNVDTGKDRAEDISEGAAVSEEPNNEASSSQLKGKYAVGDLVYFNKPANLSRAAGLAAL